MAGKSSFTILADHQMLTRRDLLLKPFKPTTTLNRFETILWIHLIHHKAYNAQKASLVWWGLDFENVQTFEQLRILTIVRFLSKVCFISKKLLRFDSKKYLGSRRAARLCFNGEWLEWRFSKETLQQPDSSGTGWPLMEFAQRRVHLRVFSRATSWSFTSRSDSLNILFDCSANLCFSPF